MKNKSFECPNCTAPLEFVSGKQAMICPYCGTKVIKDDIDFYQEDSKNARLETITNSIIKIVGTKAQRELARKEKEEELQKRAEKERKEVPIYVAFFVVVFTVLLLLEHYGFL